MYLDSAIVVKLLVPEADSSFYAGLVDGQVAWTAEIALAECYSALLRKEREGAVSSRQRRAAWKQMESDVAARRISLVGINLSVIHSANSIMTRCHPRIPLRSLDAIHLAASAECASWPLCTADARMRAAAERMGFAMTPLPESD